MTDRTMARLHRAETPHTEWCARDHRCGVTLHQSPDIIADGPMRSRAVITRVRADEANYAEIRIRLPLSRIERTARQQLGLALHLVRELLTAVGDVRAAAIARGDMPALGRRPTTPRRR